MEEYRGMPFIDMIGVEMPDGSIKHLSKTVAIFSIEEEQARFYVQQKGTRKAYVRVVRDNKHYFPYLQTKPDHIKRVTACRRAPRKTGSRFCHGREAMTWKVAARSMPAAKPDVWSLTPTAARGHS